MATWDDIYRDKLKPNSAAPGEPPASTEEKALGLNFCCPRCGGWAFGRDPGTGLAWCNSDAKGRPLSEPGAGKPCGWKEGKDGLLPRS